MTPPPETFRYDAFLSYRHEEPDQAFAWSLVKRLESAGFKVAIDERDFMPEQTFLEEVERCIRESRFTLAVLSPRYFTSGHTWEEAIITKVRDMGERRRRLIPLILEPVERPAWLYDIVGIDFVNPNAPVEPLEKLQAALRARRDGNADAGPEPEPRWIDENARGLTEKLEELYQREEEAVSIGSDPSGVRTEILEIRRQLREGGRLQAGDFLVEGRFRLIEPLGQGGFSTVWKAFDKQQRELVAVKVLHGQHAEDRSRLERFFRGARKMADLHFPGIVRVLERRLADGGFHFFVMEYLPGGDLREAVLGKRLIREEVLPLIQEVAAALSFAHERNVFHRDIKPANILLDDEGHPKLADFDLVRAADTTGGTLDGGMMGTFLYTAPEAMSAPQEAGVAADLYSLAMTVTFCLYGVDLPVEVLRDTDSFLSRLPCSFGLQAVLRKATAWEPEERFASVVDFARALAKANVAPTPLAPRGKDRPQRAPLWARNPEVPLQAFLEKEISSVLAAERAAAVLRAVEKALPTKPQDWETLGLLAWALDYFPGRSPLSADREAAERLRASVLADLWKLFPPPPVPGTDDPAWASIPGGSFVMGTPVGHPGETDERPSHRVTLSPFRLLIHPVTNGEYSRLVLGHSGTANLPAVEMTWYQAYTYAAWLGGRLPTEAEWEYAARAGCQHSYCDQDGSPTTLDKVGWNAGNSDCQLHPVGQLEPNPWGLFDMYGNVWEWVADWYGTYSSRSQVDPWGPPGGVRRVCRGGCFWNAESRVRAACRLVRDSAFEIEYLGFRVVLPPVSGRRLRAKSGRVGRAGRESIPA